MVSKRLKNSDLYRLRQVISNEELPPANTDKLIPVPEAEPVELRESCGQVSSLPFESRDWERNNRNLVSSSYTFPTAAIK